MINICIFPYNSTEEYALEENLKLALLVHVVFHQIKGKVDMENVMECYHLPYHLSWVVLLFFSLKLAKILIAAVKRYGLTK